MIINQKNLNDLFQGFKAAFNTGFRDAPTHWQQLATKVTSKTSQERYAWLGQWPQLREWVGDRAVKDLESHDYTIVNKKYEATIGVSRDSLDDDQLGIYAPMFQEMGYAAATHIDKLVFDLLKDGSTAKGYDGVAFFSGSHDVGGVAQSNTGGGAGTAWYLLQNNRALKPIIYQERDAADLQRMDKADDALAFMRDEYLYGIRHRGNVGFGFWQMAYKSQQTLDAVGFEAARVAMMERKSAEGRPLGIRPNLLIVPPSLEKEAEDLLLADRNASGATNTMKGKVQILVSEWLA